MTYEEFRSQAAMHLALLTKWPIEDASAVLGDVSEMQAEGIEPDEAAGHIFDGLDE